MTFWILDYQSKHILAQSVGRPYNQSLRVKWDPALVITTDKATVNHGGDIMFANYNPEPLQVIETNPVDTTIPNMDNELSVLKPDYTNLGLDTSTLETPKTLGPTARSKGKLNWTMRFTH